MNQNPAFRYAQRNDLSVILSFIKGLAEYEHMSDQVVADEATLEKGCSTSQEQRYCWLPPTESMWASPSSSTIFRLFWADPESIWKICSYCPHTGDGVMEKPS